MYNHKFDTFDKVQDLIRANDVQGYDAYREALSKDEQLNKEYQTYMQQLMDNQEKFTVPQVSDDYVVSHAQKALTEVKQEIADVANVKDAKITKHKSQFFNTFTVEGTYTGNATKGESEDWKTMSKQVNEALEKLSQKEWSGYKTVTAYFVNYRVNNENQFQYDIVFHGIATDEGASQGTIVKRKDSYSGEENNAIQFKSDSSKAEDRKIVSYLWDFGDGETSTEANPTHVYEKAGTYTATLTMEDDKGKESKELMTVTVDRIGATETEPNNHLEQANVIPFNTLLKGSFGDGDYRDTYTFNVSSPKEMEIFVINECKLNMTWALYHESDLRRPVTNGQPGGDVIKGTFTVKPGKYYLYVGTYDQRDGTYSVKVK